MYRSVHSPLIILRQTFLAFILTLVCGATLTAATLPPLIGHWTFERGEETRDLQGNFADLDLHGAVIADGLLDVGVNAYAHLSGYTGHAIVQKTLVAWVKLDDLNVTGGSVISIDHTGNDIFHGIVFGQNHPGQWMAGGSALLTIETEYDAAPESETGKLVQVAITYEKSLLTSNIKIYRDGILISAYSSLELPSFAGSDLEILFGLRQTLASGGVLSGAFVDAKIEEARLYAGVLLAVDLNLLKCRKVIIDRDKDGVPDHNDNCPGTYNPDQADADGDGAGDVCDPDDDNDGTDDDQDCNPFDRTIGLLALDLCDGIDNDCDGIIDNNFAPVIHDVNLSTATINIGFDVDLKLTFGDDNDQDAHIASIDWGDGQHDVLVTDQLLNLSVGKHKYTSAGKFNITVKVVDICGAAIEVAAHTVTVIDIDVDAICDISGRGTFHSALEANLYAGKSEGEGKFNFEAAYDQRTGHLNGFFKLRLYFSGVHYNSTSLDVLVVDGKQARLEGTGTWNRVADYRFEVTVEDVGTAGSGSDKIRVKVWDPAGELIYDNLRHSLVTPVAVNAILEGHVTIPCAEYDTPEDNCPGAPEICDGIDNDCDGIVDNNYAPVLLDVTLSATTLNIGANLGLNLSFSDDNDQDGHTVWVDWGDGHSGLIDVNQLQNKGSGAHKYATSGLFHLTIRITDACGTEAEIAGIYAVTVIELDLGATCQVTGKGTFTSSLGAYLGAALQEGQANYNLDAAYNEQTGILEGFFKLRLYFSGVHYNSTSLDVLVVDGKQARLEGTGTWNRVADYRFEVTVEDVGTAGSGSDKIRVKVWDPAGELIYDNLRHSLVTPVAVNAILEGHVTIPCAEYDTPEDNCPGAPEICDGIDNDCDGIVDNNYAPVLLDVTLSATTLNIGANLGLNLSFSDDNDQDGHTVWVDWGDGILETLSVDQSLNLALGKHKYGRAGIFNLSFKVADTCGDFIEITGQHTVTILALDVQLDVSVLGKGSFFSPLDAYLFAKLQTGTANYNLSAEYNDVTGLLEGFFKFRLYFCGVHYNSTRLDLLTVNGSTAVLEGVGTLNRQANHRFRVTMYDRDLLFLGIDRIRVQLWSEDGVLVYDNLAGISAQLNLGVELLDGFITINAGADASVNLLTPSATGSTQALTDLQVYPNPTRDRANLVIPPLETEATVRVMDQTGRLLLTREIPAGQEFIELDLSDQRFASGLYLLSVTCGDTQLTHRLSLVK